MAVLTRSVGVSTRRREGNRMTCHHAVTVCVRGASCIQVGGGGKQLFVHSAFVIHVHGHGWLHHGECNCCSKQFGSWRPDRVAVNTYLKSLHTSNI